MCGDSLKRQHKSHPVECRVVTPVMVMVETKRWETERVHEGFEERLGRCLKSNKEVRRPFAKIIKETYPNSSESRVRRERARSWTPADATTSDPSRGRFERGERGPLQGEKRFSKARRKKRVKGKGERIPASLRLASEPLKDVIRELVVSKILQQVGTSTGGIPP